MSYNISKNIFVYIIYQNVPEAHWPVYQVKNQEHYWENHQEDIVHLMMVMMTMRMINSNEDNENDQKR